MIRTNSELLEFAKRTLEKKRERQHRYWLRNRERLLVTSREYRESNRDAINFRRKLRRCEVIG